jgi:predicted ATPase
MPLVPGTHVGGYEILDLLGAGGMGEVYRARDLRLKRDVALKFLQRREALAYATIERFLREARAASALNHPNIITIHEIGDTDTGHYIVMELVAGRTVRELTKSPMEVAAVLRIVTQIAQALAVAHAAGIVHRDIKPENIMVRSDGLVKVLDFGLARVLPTELESDNRVTEEVTTHGALLGTLRYMSPEQARGETVGTATDMFSLGVVMYELATGHHPFAAESNVGTLNAIISHQAVAPSHLNPEISPALDSLILQVLENDPRLRPDAAPFAASLLALTESRPSVHVAPAAPRATRHVVGRERERGELAAAFDGVAVGHGALICVSGEPGIGKTTLVDEFLGDLHEGDRTVLVGRGRCSERLAGAEAYLPLLEVLESLIRSPSGDYFARVMKLLAPTWYAQIAPLVDTESSGSRSLPQTANAPERFKRELAQLVHEVSRTHPLILVVDDVHWMDLSSTDIFAYLASRFDGMRVLAIVMYRPMELLTGHHPFVPVKLDLEARGICREIALSGLGREAIQRYLALEFPQHEFPPEFVDLIHTKTEGSPLFAFELLRYLRGKKVIVSDQGSWRLGDLLPDIARELPDSVRSMIQRQIERVDDIERRLLTTASVQGYQFDAAIVARVAGLEPVDVEERLEMLDQIHGLVRRVDERELPDRTLTLRYRFAHVLYQNALYLSLTPSRKAALSRAVADAILQFHREQSTSLALELALLFEAARDFANATAYFTRAARNAARIAGFEEAVVLARRGLALIKSLPESEARDRQELDLQIVLASSLIATKGYAAAETEHAYGEALSLCARVGETPQIFPVLYGRWVYYTVSGNMTKSVDIAQEFSTLAEQQKADAPRVVSHRLLGTSLAVRGDLGAARAHLERAIELYNPDQHQSLSMFYGQDVKIAGMCNLSITLWMLGYQRRAIALGKDALAQAVALSQPNTLGYAALYSGALLHTLSGLHEPVRDAVDRLKKLSVEHQLPTWGAVWRVFAGWISADAGNGIAVMRDGLDRLDAIHSVLFSPIFLTLLAERCGESGQHQLGLDALNRAQQVAEQGGEHWFDAELQRIRGRLIAAQSGVDPGAADHCYRCAMEIARAQGAKSLELRAATDLAAFLGEQRRWREAQDVLAGIHCWIDEGFELSDLPRTQALAEHLDSAARAHPQALS